MEWRKRALGLASGNQIATEAPLNEIDGVRCQDPPTKRARVDAKELAASLGSEGKEVDATGKKGPQRDDDATSDFINTTDNYLIYEDSDSEDEEADEGREKKPNNLLFSCAEDPLPLTECLLLSPEEAFFLSYGLGCLTGELQ